VNKREVSDLVLFGGAPLFDEIKSTSNLVQPDPKKFFEYARKSFDARWITNNGPVVQELELRLAEVHGVSHCVSVCNGLWGLVLSMSCLALDSRREVVMPSLTYRRLADIVAWLDLVPRFCEVSPETLGVSRATVEACLNDETAIILAPHPIVNLCDIDGLEDLAKESGIPLLFDSVEAAHATHGGKQVGGFGAAECFSMHASKFLNGFEGGYVTTNDAALAEKLRIKRAFGFSGEDNIVELGLNAKLNELHAAMTLASVDDIPDQLVRNMGLYDVYERGLRNTSIRLVQYRQDEVRTHKNILVELTGDWPYTREKTLELLHSENMLARPYYHPPLHEKETSYETIVGNLDLSSELSLHYLLLPSGDFLNVEDVEAVCQFLTFLENNSQEIVQGGA